MVGQHEGCPWTPERWENLGKLIATMEAYNKTLDEIKIGQEKLAEGNDELMARVDALNHVKTRATKISTSVGGGAGAIAAAMVFGAWEYIKTKLNIN